MQATTLRLKVIPMCENGWQAHDKPRREGPPFKVIKLKRGEFAPFHCVKRLAIQWQEVTLLSSVHDASFAEMFNARKKSGGHMFWKAIATAWGYLARIIRICSAVRDWLKVICMRNFKHFVDMSVYNAFILYKKRDGRHSQLEPRLDYRLDWWTADCRKSRHKWENSEGEKLDNLTQLVARHF